MQSFPRLRMCSVPSQFCRASFFWIWNRRRCHYWQTSRASLRAARLSRRLTTPFHPLPRCQRSSSWHVLSWFSATACTLRFHPLSHFFKLQIGPRADTVLVHHLKPSRAPEDTPVAVPPPCGRPTASAPPPIVAPPPVAPKEPVSHCPSHVTFAFPEAVPDLRPSPAFHPSGRPARSVRQPERYPP
jgi:hypothetical protein